MHDPSLSKRVLQAVADAHPEDGCFTVTRVDIRRGWGDLVNVTIRAEGVAHTQAGQARGIRDAVERALGTERFRVRLQEVG